MLPLSVVIITYNEESNIRNCITSVYDLADEIIVLDSGSTDNTVQIAKALGARVEKHEFDGHIQQKNRAKNLAKNEWVLSLDADERLSPQLSVSIQNALSNPNAEGYCMNRLNHFAGRPIKTCGWYPDTKLRLWKKQAGEWMGNNPHDKFGLYQSEPQFLAGDILHFTYKDQKAMFQQAKKFAGISSEKLSLKPLPVLLAKFLISPIFKFLKSYFLYGGILSGLDGIAICLAQTSEVFHKYRLAILLKMNRN